jgi:hypothetical protein
MQHDSFALELTIAREIIEIPWGIGDDYADCADPASAIRLTSDSAELHRQFVFFEGNVGVRRTAYLPPRLVVHAGAHAGQKETTAQLAGLVSLMRGESTDDHLGGRAMLNALSTAMFALVLRLASETEDAPRGLLALAGHPRLAPAVAALFNEPARAWSPPDLTRLCNMSRATLARQFHEKLGRIQ